MTAAVCASSRVSGRSGGLEGSVPVSSCGGRCGCCCCRRGCCGCVAAILANGCGVCCCGHWRYRRSVRAASGTPSAAVMGQGGASICGGLMWAAVATWVTGWMVVHVGDTAPPQDRGPQLGSQVRQEWNLAWTWQPSWLLPQCMHKRCVHPSCPQIHRLWVVLFFQKAGSPNPTDRSSRPRQPHQVQCVRFWKHGGQ